MKNSKYPYMFLYKALFSLYSLMYSEPKSVGLIAIAGRQTQGQGTSNSIVSLIKSSL